MEGKHPTLILLALMAVVAALALAACGDDDDDDTSAATTTEETTAEEPSGGGETIPVTESDFKLDPADPTAKAGEITFELSNDGEAPHNLEVEGNGIEEVSDTINPGDSTSFSVNLEAGTYELTPSRDGTEPTVLLTVPDGWNSWEGPNRFDGHRAGDSNEEALARSTWLVGLTVLDVQESISNQNVQVAAGQLGGPPVP